jgi:nucleoside-diphosphate-sugar epimerase
MTRALVTGATGMIGSHLVERLVAEGVEVRAFIRPSSDARILESLPVEIMRGTVTDPADLARAAQDSEWVFHNAAHFNVGSGYSINGDARRIRSSIVDITEGLLAASMAAGVKRFVYTSSTSVYSVTAPSPISEDASLEPSTEYGRAKVLAEARVRAYHEKGLATTIIRPCITYGPRDRHFFPATLRLSRTPLLPLIGGGSHLIDLVYVADVVELIWEASQRDVAIGKAYNAASGAPVSMRQLADDFRAVTGQAPRVLAVSPKTAKTMARVGRWYLRKLAPGMEEILSPVGIASFSRDVYYDVSRAKKDLNYSPRFTFKLGLETCWRNEGNTPNLSPTYTATHLGIPRRT